MAQASNQVRFRMGGDRVHTMELDAKKLMGDALLELERELGESAFAWIDRMIRSFESFRTRDVSVRDILGIVYLSRTQEDPGISWADVAKQTAPLAFQLLGDDEPSPPPPPVAVPVSTVVPAPAQSVAQVLGPPPVAAPQGMPLPDVGGHTVPPPALVAPVVSPLVAAHEAAQQQGAVQT